MQGGHSKKGFRKKKKEKRNKVGLGEQTRGERGARRDVERPP